MGMMCTGLGNGCDRECSCESKDARDLLRKQRCQRFLVKAMPEISCESNWKARVKARMPEIVGLGSGVGGLPKMQELVYWYR